MDGEREDNRRHKAVLVEVGDWKEEIDEALAPLIAAIWKHGIETMMSCQETAPGIAWIEFVSMTDLVTFLNLIARYEPGVDTFYKRVNYQRTGPMSALPWEYQVNLIDINELDELEGCPSNFEVAAGVYFPVTDVPLILNRLNDAQAADIS